MTWKQIETSREVRLWVKEIVVPVVGFAASTLLIPEVREAVAAKAGEVKEKINKKLKRES